jgi:NUMOD4 motif/HNH endonuclease
VENWKRIEIAPKYEVSDEGRVRNIKTGRVLKLYTRKDNDYVVVSVEVNGKTKTCRVSRLVVTAFVPNTNPSAQTEANHEDKDRSNNRASNLTWVTPKKNRSVRSPRTLWMPKLVKKVLELSSWGLTEDKITKKLLRWKPWHR